MSSLVKTLYKGMIQRTRAILAYLYDYFLDDFDFFHIHVCGDDVYMIVENMKEFLASEEVKHWENASERYLCNSRLRPTTVVHIYIHVPRYYVRTSRNSDVAT